MEPLSLAPIPVFRRREYDGAALDERKLKRGLESGDTIRVASGSFVARDAWTALTPLQQHAVRVIEAGERAHGTILVTHWAAAATWSIDHIGSWPTRVDVRVPQASGGRSSGTFRRRAIGVDVPVVPWGRHFVTSPAQTVADLAAISSRTTSIILMDQARWARRPGGPLASVEEIACAIEGVRSGRARSRAYEALEASTDLSDSVRESQSRVLIIGLGFPKPELQRRFILPGGREAYPDFFWEQFNHAGEFDGIGKYFDSTFTRGRTPEEVLVAEKDRGDELRRLVGRLSRWRTPALKDPRILYDILSADGLISKYPRPRAGRIWE